MRFLKLAPPMPDAPFTRLLHWLATPAGTDGLLLVGLTTVFLISFVYHPPDVPRFTVCLLKSTTQFDCPGCGLTRSFCALSQGQLGKAFFFNKLGPFAYLLGLLLWLRALSTTLNYQRPARLLNQALSALPLGRIGLVALAGYGVVRIIVQLAGYRI